MKSKFISGTIRYEALGTGAWTIVDDSGNEWLPVNMPEQLKKAGKHVKVSVREVEAGVSVFMRGTPVEIVSFPT
jgi:hypothetical protein